VYSTLSVVVVGHECMEWSRIADGMLDDDGSTNMTVKSLLIPTKYTVAVLVMGRAVASALC